MALLHVLSCSGSPPHPHNKTRTLTAKSALLGFIHFLKAKNIRAMSGFVPFLRTTK